MVVYAGTWLGHTLHTGTQVMVTDRRSWGAGVSGSLSQCDKQSVWYTLYIIHEFGICMKGWPLQTTKGWFIPERYLKSEINVANFPWVGVLTKLVGKYHSFKLTRRPTHPSHRTAPRKTLDFTFFHDAKLTSSIILIIPFNWPGGHPPHLKDLHNASVGDTITRVWSKKSKKNWRNSWSLLTFLTV